MVGINRNARTGCGQCMSDCIINSPPLREGKVEVSGDYILCGHRAAVCPLNVASIPEYDMGDVEELSQEQAELDSNRLLKATKYRCSARRFKQKPVSSGDSDMPLQAGRYTVTAKNVQGYRFIFVQKGLGILKIPIWDGVGRTLDSPTPGPTQVYRGFYETHMADSRQDCLFHNALAVLSIISEVSTDAGLATQNTELMGVSLGFGFLYDGYLRRVAEMNSQVLD